MECVVTTCKGSSRIEYHIKWPLVYLNKCCSACSNFQASSVALVGEGHHNNIIVLMTIVLTTVLYYCFP